MKGLWNPETRRVDPRPTKRETDRIADVAEMIAQVGVMLGEDLYTTTAESLRMFVKEFGSSASQK
jgi:hypothetical protein